jgi:hypothetical protein
MTESVADQEKRLDFVKEMYRVYWSNMARSMEGTWKVIAPLTIVGTIIGAIHKDYLPVSLGLSLALAIVFWALNVTIDLNAWHRRNLFFLTKAERVFLLPEDYGRLLPPSYRTPPKGWIEFYIIHSVTLLAIIGFIILYGAAWKLPGTGFVRGWLLPLVVLGAGLILTAVNFVVQETSARCRFSELFGDKRQDDFSVRARRSESEIRLPPV